MKSALAAAVLLMAAGAARAEVTQRTDTGFQSSHAADVAATPERVYAALGEVGKWWDEAHTYSGSAANMTLSLTPGGCFCEQVGEGGVRHGVVTLALPGSMLRLDGGLGPLQGEGVSATMTFQITAKGEGSHLEARYNVGGYHAAGVKQWADPVDQVLGVQFARLTRYLETGTR